MKRQETIFRQKHLYTFAFIVFLLVYAAHFIGTITRQDSLTWMDPYQYLNFARDFIAGARTYAQFEVPSLFPFLLIPFLTVSPTIPSALCANMFFMAAILSAGYCLCGIFNIRRWFGIAAIEFLCSPLIIGLSHSLYAELALSALVAWQSVVWLTSDHFKKPWMTVLFVAMFCIGIMTKSTYPVYFIGPFFLEVFGFLKNRELLGAIKLSAIFIGTVAGMVIIELVAFPNSLSYFRTGFFTQLPVMRLIGPSQVSPIASISYYFVNIWQTMLYFLTPFLLLALFPRLRNNKDVYLWAWFLVSLAVFTVSQVKEPRHAAPALFPAVMIITLGISRISRLNIRTVVTTLVLLLSVLQYILVTRNVRATPYFLDRPSCLNEILSTMIANDDDRDSCKSADGSIDTACWKFAKNFAITGYDAPMALSILWNLNPAVTYDIDFLKQPKIKSSHYGFDHFEDLFFLEAFSVYNRQGLWNGTYYTLDYNTVTENTDYIIAGENAPEDLCILFPRYRLVNQWNTGRGTVRLLQADKPSKASYRTLYARRYLAQGTLNPETTAAIYFDLLLNAALRHDRAQIMDLKRELASTLDHMPKPKNIYWTHDRAALIERMNSYLQARP